MVTVTASGDGAIETRLQVGFHFNLASAWRFKRCLLNCLYVSSELGGSLMSAFGIININ